MILKDIYTVLIYRADLKESHKLDMLNVLIGRIEFYPGLNIQGVSPIRAPNLRKQVKVVDAGASKPDITIDEIIAKMYVNRTVEDDLSYMVAYIRNTNITREER